ncbi:hypothetical protein QTV49_001834 [Vibrio vulnificus]|nr:hypothetical protein [Vibrio vulnificus]
MKITQPNAKPSEWLVNLQDEFPYICKLLLFKLREGETFDEAIQGTLEDLLSPYALGSIENSGMNSDFCKVLIAHNQHFSRRVLASLALLLVGFVGVFFGYFQLMLFCGLTLLIMSFVSTPVERLHTIKKLL